jgi:hypothetical protein
MDATQYTNPIDFVLKDKKPTQGLLDLLKIQDVQHDGTLASIVDATQKSWIRPAGKERWEIDNTQFVSSDEVWKLIDDLQLRAEVKPAQIQYDYVLLMGATAMRMKLRLEYFVQLVQQGMSCEQLVVLVGQRALTDEEKEFLKQQYNAIDAQTESDAARVIVQNLSDTIQKKLQFISVSMLADGKGGMRRPTTADTVNAWLETSVQPGSCLAISNQPFVAYQHSVTRGLLPQTCTLETVGQGSTTDTRIGVYLDSVARILYQEQKNNK